MKPIKTCIKCFRYLPAYAAYYLDDSTIYFCEECANKLQDKEKFPDMDSFINEKLPVTQNILKAREDREKGNSPWQQLT